MHKIKFVLERRWDYESDAYNLIGFNCWRLDKYWRVAIVLFNLIIGIEKVGW